MKRIHTKFPLLLSDERSAVRQKTAVLFSLGMLMVAVLGLVMMALGEQTYQNLDRRVLVAQEEQRGESLL